jgi:S1-C subfamily serine protease
MFGCSILIVLAKDSLHKENVEDRISQQRQAAAQPPSTPPEPSVPIEPNIKVPQETITLALKRNVYITAHDHREIGYSGSGGRIGHGLILTARHVVFEKKDDQVPKLEIEVDHVAAKIVAEDLPNDLAILEIPDDGMEPITLAYDADLLKLGTPVAFVGTLQTGYISRLSSPENGSDMFEILTFDADHGISGSVVYTFDGRVIGISQRGDADDTIRLAIVRNLKPLEKLLKTLKNIR